MNKFTYENADMDANGVLSLDLVTILRLLPIEGQSFDWRILEIEITGDISKLGIDNLDLEEKVNDSENGYAISWDFLCQLAATINQTINLAVEGWDDNVIIEIECIDSSSWRISSNKSDIIQDWVAAKASMKSQ
jgi:hypothetical protein